MAGAIALTNKTSGLFSASFCSLGNRRRQAAHQGAKKSTTTSRSCATRFCSSSGLVMETKLAGPAQSHLERWNSGQITVMTKPQPSGYIPHRCDQGVRLGAHQLHCRAVCTSICAAALLHVRHDFSRADHHAFPDTRVPQDIDACNQGRTNRRKQGKTVAAQMAMTICQRRVQRGKKWQIRKHSRRKRRPLAFVAQR